MAFMMRATVPMHRTILEIGEALVADQTRQITELLKSALQKEWTNILGYMVRVANVPPMWASEAGHILADREDQPFGATYYDTANGMRKFSLRSIPEKQDVARIAEVFGGGGHRNAAGFTVPAPMVAADALNSSALRLALDAGLARLKGG